MSVTVVVLCIIVMIVCPHMCVIKNAWYYFTILTDFKVSVKANPLLKNFTAIFK